MRSLNIKTWHWILYFFLMLLIAYFLADALIKVVVITGSLALFSGVQLREINMTVESAQSPYYWHNFLNAIYYLILVPSLFLCALGLQALLYNY
ncbi:hypothetical protein A2572_04395 [Candidatus Collierbacteria bacterium RIFOXYD1_FULL_40_9]|uniref:Uncharacterized protein n=1 Tax=Candidatus Collierbacteria bacterium RIFOXYD1_FULL_40_9 TaxID=1817731 RepID=A0A1F5FPR7_9BACT|nr:MAG: hypothetical protein A2572_04395 [Candidatus Collierbacteria bacterium RIFOXYD1_FULL_40_9]